MKIEEVKKVIAHRTLVTYDNTDYTVTACILRLKEGKIKEYNSKMEEKEAYKLYFDEAYKYTNFYEEGDE